MDRAALRIAEPAPDVGGARWSALLPGLVALSVGLLATFLGADRARKATPADEIARAAAERALEHGSDDPHVAGALRTLRATLGRSPLDTETRVAYAGLLLHVSSRAAERAVPAFHARVAARYAPVTVPVVRAAAQILARSGETTEASRLVREMFGYDATRAARLLLQIEPWLEAERIEASIPDVPTAWAAWLTRLRSAGRHGETKADLAMASARWPDSAEILLLASNDAFARRDWSELERLLPLDRPLPERAPFAFLFVHRARVRARNGDREGAHDDISRALRLAPGRGSLQLAAGDTLADLGYWREARRVWRGFERATPETEIERRAAVLLRLARLEQQHGDPVVALRLWRSVANLEPSNDEARRAVRELTGLPP